MIGGLIFLALAVIGAARVITITGRAMGRLARGVLPRRARLQRERLCQLRALNEQRAPRGVL